MLYPKALSCPANSTIPALVEDIDCKITELAKAAYNDVVFSLGCPISGTVMSDLLNYRRILFYKYCNPDYACPFTVEMIASKVKILIHK